MSNLTITVNELLEPESTMESLTTHPSSLTCVSSYSPVQLNSTEDLQTWLQQAFPANHSALPENELELMTNEICGLPQSSASAWYDHDTHCWRTSQASLLVDILEPFSETWPRQGMTQDGEFYPQPKWERRISETDYGLWPTPRASPNENRQTKPTPSQLAGKHGMNLATAVNMFPTPTVIDAGTGRINKSASKGATERPTLAMMAKKNLWRTPSSQLIDPKKSVVKLTGRTPQDPQVGLADQVGGKLNPDWTEWLMGWPIGWTDLKPLAMDKFQQWQRKHGICLPPEFNVYGDRPLPDWCNE